jgi:hypothetical protein
MNSFKSKILEQITSIPEGEIFTFKDLVFPIEKLANTAVVLSDLCKEGKLIRFEKGAYYRPKNSNLGLGILPVYQDEQVRYLTDKLNGYLTGAHIYNKMALTEQVPSVLTIAVPYPVRPFKLNKLFVECVKSYIEKPKDSETLYLARILDSIKDIKHIPATHPQIAFNRIYEYHIAKLSKENKQKIVFMSLNYPARVRKVLSDMLENGNNRTLQRVLLSSINPTTHFDLSYKN